MRRSHQGTMSWERLEKVYTHSMIQRDLIPNENFESWNEYTLHVLKRHEVYIDAHVHLEGFFSCVCCILQHFLFHV
jgi:hypothetical protein